MVIVPAMSCDRAMQPPWHQVLQDSREFSVIRGRSRAFTRGCSPNIGGCGGDLPPVLQNRSITGTTDK